MIFETILEEQRTLDELAQGHLKSGALYCIMTL
jgi:hypothetical protein